MPITGGIRFIRVPESNQSINGGRLQDEPWKYNVGNHLAATSVGILEEARIVLDLNDLVDSPALVDMNGKVS
ncbi:hypothetical protein AS888_07865 [Peribacillus simplex]|uniref:Uncharacterized protein n=2 Tax=Peribacillus TaxID=2675229 RepID=A0A109MV24_9BACI|nr:hypothetical protein [Peribacillus simplex]KWW15947.1 hypothetical protein AS888_07865 [Peribacillus simplex]